MINANELRIGNKVLFAEDGTEFIIEELHRTGAQLYDISEETWIEFEYLEGVPLSEEKLSMLGFVKSADKQMKLIVDLPYAIKGELIAMKTIDWFCFLETKGVYASANLMYVHQIQNLYFALTTKELPCK